MSDRRNDVGSKILISTISILVSAIMGFSIYSAQQAQAKSQSNAVNVGKLETANIYFKETLDDMKGDIKAIRDVVVVSGSKN